MKFNISPLLKEHQRLRLLIPEPACKETFEANIVGAKFIQADVFELTEKALKKIVLTEIDKSLIKLAKNLEQFEKRDK